MTIAILVPYKNRPEYLEIFLNKVPKYLEEINGIREYVIYIAEQTSSDIFNLALSRNVAAKFALAEAAPEYLIFHDVDTIPIQNIDYGPRERNVAWFMSAGGCKIHIEAFLGVNGYNPAFVGWGSEDKEFYVRLSCMNFEVSEWHISNESRQALMLNLEMPQLLTATDALEWSKGYFGHNGVGPRFLAAEDSGVYRLSTRYDKSKDFLLPEYSRTNDAIWEEFRSMQLSDKLTYINANGVNRVQLSRVCRKELSRKIVWLTYQTGAVLGSK